MQSKTLLIEKYCRSVMIGLLIVTMIFVLLAWTPDSLFEELLGDLFPSTKSGIYKLSLLEFSHQETSTQFQIFIQLENISRLPMENAQAVITLLDNASNHRTIVYPLSTMVILPSQKITFSVTFTEKFPVSRYTILFQYLDGRPIPHKRRMKKW